MHWCLCIVSSVDYPYHIPSDHIIQNYVSAECLRLPGFVVSCYGGGGDMGELPSSGPFCSHYRNRTKLARGSNRGSETNLGCVTDGGRADKLSDRHAM